MDHETLLQAADSAERANAWGGEELAPVYVDDDGRLPAVVTGAHPWRVETARFAQVRP